MTNPAQKIGEQLVAHCQKGDAAWCLDNLYADNAVSVEAVANPETGSAMTEGLDGIRGKHAWWDTNFEVHSANVDGPFPHGEDRFGVIFEIDTTDKNSGQRSQMKELAVYHIADGKIVREEFFYPMGA
ncbi:MAG: nuclear transport factor 2 family protein [Phyllobacteriaceae bacterium]|nr:nuclear transport factor 2 family protein [Phyllobacteriaceae bacterium]